MSRMKATGCGLWSSEVWGSRLRVGWLRVQDFLSKGFGVLIKL